MKRSKKNCLRQQHGRLGLKNHRRRSRRARNVLAVITLVIWLVPVLVAELGIFEAALNRLPDDSKSEVDYVSSDHAEAQQAVIKRDKSGTTTCDVQRANVLKPVFQANSNVLSPDSQRAGLCESGQTHEACPQAERV